MIIYNITTKVHISIDKEWLQWQKETFIPEILGTGCFTGGRIYRLLDQDDREGKTYALQFSADSEELYQSYLLTHAPLIRQSAIETWGEKIISFHSLLEVIH